MQRPSPAIYLALVAGVFIWGAVTENSRRSASEAARIAAEKDAAYQAAQEPQATENDASQDSPPPAAPQPAVEEPTLVGPGRFHRLPDGTPVPPLPSSAPLKMKLGVAIFRYKGAQSPPPSQRTREEALALAQKAIVVAGQDFARAVELGDQGSSGNIGWIQRGILEPTVEHAVFSLENGAFTPEPVDTPRGFWVAKRLR